MKEYSRCKWLELIEGILLIILGIVTLVCPTGVFWGFSIIYGIMAIVTGVADIIFYVKMEKYTGFGPVLALVSGVMSVLAGAMLLMYPNAGQLIIVMLIPIWFIAHSISRLSHLPLVRIGSGKGVLHLLACAQHYRNCVGNTHDILTVDSTVFDIGAHRGLSHSAWSGLRYHGGELQEE